MSTDYSFIINDLLDWYDANKRELPWRDQGNAYYTWVSEIMLQQTRVEAVKGYFKRFITALPTVEALATADPDQLLKLWEGLGYYNRVRNMQKAAVTVVEEYNGQLPKDYKALLGLSGIGTYTAGAIASIAYKLPVPAVDGNVLRVTKRLTACYDDITQAKVKKSLEDDLLKIMPEERSGDLNQALMDLGATICIPNGKPLCTQCPLNHCCKAFSQDLTSVLPIKASKKARKKEEKTVILFVYQNQYAICQRGEKGLLAGLWEFPNLEEQKTLSKFEKMLSENKVNYDSLELLGTAKHIFSHVEWDMIGYRVVLNEKPESLFEHAVWVTKESILEDYAIPTAFKHYTKQL